MKNLTLITEHSDCLSASTYSDSEKWQLHRLRVKFGKQPLELWMFVPCDEDGNVLEEPLHDDFYYWEYKKGEERCLFEGNFTYLKQKDYYIIYLNESTIYLSWNKSKIIEDIISFDIQLTQTAIKKLGWI